MFPIKSTLWGVGKQFPLTPLPFKIHGIILWLPHHTGPQETQQDYTQLSTTSILSSEHRIVSSAPTPTLHGSMEPLHIPSSLSTWVPWAASSTLGSSHLPGLYPGKETCAPSVLRFHTPLTGLCHSPYPCAELREPRQRSSLFVRSPRCLLTPGLHLSGALLSSGVQKLYSLSLSAPCLLSVNVYLSGSQPS